MKMTKFASIREALIACDAEKLTEAVNTAVSDGAGANAILNDGLIAAMDVIGERMETGEMFIPEVLMAAQLMGGAVETLRPHLAEGSHNSAGKVLLGTVKGDVHDIGKNLVFMMLESAGFEVKDVGVDVPADTFVSEIKSFQPDIVALSALLTTTIPMMKTTIDALTTAGVRDSVKVIVGGAPVSQSFADKIGADGYGADAGSASRLARKLVGEIRAN